MIFINIVKLFIKVRFIFFSPNKASLLIFDDESVHELRYVLPYNDYYILQTRVENINKIYISPKIFFLFIKNFRGNFFDAYLISLITIVDPKLILTFIDNSFKFYKFSKILSKKYQFLAIQNGARYEHKTIKYLIKNKILNYDYFNPYIPNYCCFGQYEIDDYKKNNIKVDKFYKVGSLRVANFLKDLKRNNKNFKKKFDICYVSEPYAWDLILNKNLENWPMEERVGQVLKFVVKFCIKYKKKLVILTRQPKKKIFKFQKEQIFFKKYLSPQELCYAKKNLFIRREKFFSYKTMMQSKIVVSSMSTMLRESLSLRIKTLVCSYMPTDIFKFPIDDYLCVIKSRKYDEFEKRLLYLLTISKKNYFYKLRKKINYMIGDNCKSTIKNIKVIINSFIN